MLISSRIIVSIALLASWQAFAQQVTSSTEPRQVYLKCSQPNEPEGVSDLHIDFDKRVITDHFATVRPYKERGPFLVAETFAEMNGSQINVSTLRVNRYTFSYEFIAPHLQLHKRVQCVAIDRKM